MKSFHSERLGLVGLIWRRLAWLEIIYPLILGALLLGPLTFVIFFGQKHRSLAGLADGNLLEMFLRISPRSLESHNLSKDFLVLDDSNGQQKEASPEKIENKRAGRESRQAEALLARISADLESIPADKIQRLFLYLPSSNFADSAPQMEEISDLLHSKRFGEKTTVILDQDDWVALNSDNFKSLDVRFGLDCDGQIQSFCAFDRAQFPGWIVTRLVDLSTADDSGRLKEGLVISDNLPSFYPSFVLDLLPRDEFQVHRVNERGAFFAERLDFVDKNVFLQLGGNFDGSQVTTPGHEPTPILVFWAQIAEMLKSSSTIIVVPAWAINLVSVFLALILIGCSIFLGHVAALSTALLTTALLALVNWQLLSRIGIYAPLFMPLYVSFVATLGTIFFMVSLELFLQLTQREQVWVYQESLHMRANFISLLSHNLNTPVAKIQGMVDVLMMAPPTENVRERLKQVQILVARLQMTIRTVLVTTSLQDRSLTAEAQNIRVISALWQNQIGPNLKRMGVPSTWMDREPKDEWSLMALSFDTKALQATLAGLGALFCDVPALANDGGPVTDLDVMTGRDGSSAKRELLVSGEIVEDPEREGCGALRVYFEMKGRTDFVLPDCCDSSHFGARNVEMSFLQLAVFRMLEQSMDIHLGRIEVSRDLAERKIAVLVLLREPLIGSEIAGIAARDGSEVATESREN